MFHVKHTDSKNAAEEDFGREMAARVERFLDQRGFCPDHPDFLHRIERFASTLNLWSRQTNLTAAPGNPDEVAFHVIDSVMPLVLASEPAHALKDVFNASVRVLDLGSGAGFPGLILAAASDAHFILLERRRKRVSFLKIAAAEMGLANVEVVTSHQGPGAFDVVVARAFAQPAIVYPLAAGTLRTGGRAIMYTNLRQPLDQAEAHAARLSNLNSISYVIPHGDRPFDGRLIVWRKD